MSVRKYWPGLGPVDRIGRGVYTDPDHNLHLDAGEIVRALGYEDNAESRAALIRQVRERMPALMPPAEKGRQV